MGREGNWEGKGAGLEDLEKKVPAILWKKEKSRAAYNWEKKRSYKMVLKKFSKLAKNILCCPLMEIKDFACSPVWKNILACIESFYTPQKSNCSPLSINFYLGLPGTLIFTQFLSSGLPIRGSFSQSGSIFASSGTFSAYLRSALQTPLYKFSQSFLHKYLALGLLFTEHEGKAVTQIADKAYFLQSFDSLPLICLNGMVSGISTFRGSWLK